MTTSLCCTYDALNSLTGITYPDSTENVTYAYDQGTNGIGRLTTIVDQSGSTAYGYDARGNVVSKTSSVDGHVFAIVYQYDAADQLTGITYPDGLQVTYGRDAAERITSVTASRNGVPQTVASGITYEPFGPLSGFTYGNGLAESRTYDTDYRLTSIAVPGIEQWTLNKDADDDLIGIADSLNSANSQLFGYDALNRLTNAQGAYGTLGYGYDLDGNRTQLTSNGTATTYNYAGTSNRLLSVVPAQAGTQSYQYDADGNTLSDGVHIYTFNDANRLTGYDSQADVYLHNGLGQRVRKPSPVTPGDANGDGVIDQNDLHGLQDALKGNAPVTPGMDCNQDGQVNNQDKACVANQIGDTKNQGKGSGKGTGGGTTTAATTAATIGNALYIYFAYDEAGHLLGEYDQNGSLIEAHIWLGNRPIAVITPTATDYVTTDQLGTPRVITDSNKTVVWNWSSDPFGSTAPNDNPGGMGLFTYNLRAPGQYYDAETGHNYNYFRDYDPATGRYIESDPIGLFGGVNTYVYVDGNPILYFDLSGLCWIYSQSTGVISHVNTFNGMTDYMAIGYSGYGAGVDNPKMQNVGAHRPNPSGPLPQGGYTIGKEETHITQAGIKLPDSMLLTPDSNNQMFNRKGFLIHGSNDYSQQNSSEGCLVFKKNVRDRIGKSGDHCLIVTQ